MEPPPPPPPALVILELACFLGACSGQSRPMVGGVGPAFQWVPLKGDREAKMGVGGRKEHTSTAPLISLQEYRWACWATSCVRVALEPQKRHVP